MARKKATILFEYGSILALLRLTIYANFRKIATWKKSQPIPVMQNFRKMANNGLEKQYRNSFFSVFKD